MNPIYQIQDTSSVFSPALLFYKDLIRQNVARAIDVVGGDLDSGSSAGRACYRRKCAAAACGYAGGAATAVTDHRDAGGHPRYGDTCAGNARCFGSTQCGAKSERYGHRYGTCGRYR